MFLEKRLNGFRPQRRRRELFVDNRVPPHLSPFRGDLSDAPQIAPKGARVGGNTVIYKQFAPPALGSKPIGSVEI